MNFYHNNFPYKKWHNYLLTVTLLFLTIRYYANEIYRFVCAVVDKLLLFPRSQKRPSSSLRIRTLAYTSITCATARTTPKSSPIWPQVRFRSFISSFMHCSSILENCCVKCCSCNQQVCNDQISHDVACWRPSAGPSILFLLVGPKGEIDPDSEFYSKDVIQVFNVSWTNSMHYLGHSLFIILCLIVI